MIGGPPLDEPVVAGASLGPGLGDPPITPMLGTSAEDAGGPPDADAALGGALTTTPPAGVAVG